MKRDRFLSGEIRMFLKNAVNKFSEYIARETEELTKSTFGKMLNISVLFGPLTFLPTLHNAWFAPNIDAFRTPTWGLMLIINIATWLSVSKNGEWHLRLVMIIWIIIMFLFLLATIMR